MRSRNNTQSLVAALLAAAIACVAPPLALAGSSGAGAVDVTTHHYDVGRTGYNPAETLLTTASVGSSSFTRITTANFTGHVDAQPLVISASTWAGWGYSANFPHDVVYVVDSNNDLFAIDGVTGQILLQRNFGAPVALSNLPGGCNNNASTVGITSTPAMDPSLRKLFLITYTWESNAPVYRVHAINPATLADLNTPVVVSASQTLSDGSKATFYPAAQRQRSALLIANGNVYAGFASFCDIDMSQSRGWVMGWNESSLAPLAQTAMMNQESLAMAGGGLNLGWTDIRFLSSVWMSGFGLSADSSGNIYLQTGNSNATNKANLPDSTVKLASNLSMVSYFTPANFATLDDEDADRGSTGVLVTPKQSNGLDWAVGAGKDGRMFLFNTSNLGGYVSGGPDVPSNVQIGGCWCGPAYFVGSDGRARILSNGGTQALTWILPTSSNGVLTQEAGGVALASTDGEDPGFQSSVSSNGTNANSAVIWSVSRPSSGQVYLQALDATSGAGGGTVTDASGNTWALGAPTRNLGEHVILVNGKATSGIAAKIVIANDGNAYHLNGYSQWWTGNGATWTQVSGPPGVRPMSAPGTTVLASGTGVVTDAGGNTWGFGPNIRNPGEHNIVRNGIPTTGWAVKLVIASDGTAWHYNYYSQWFTGDGVNWTQHASGPVLATPSGVGATITGPSGSLTDSAGNVWSFGTQQRNPGEYEIYVNGQPSGWGWAVKMVQAFGGTVWQYNYYGQWFINQYSNGAVAFPLQASAPAAYNAAVGSIAWPSAAGELRELQWVSVGSWPVTSTNANVVPVVANGHVYVATDNQLQIWGLQ